MKHTTHLILLLLLVAGTASAGVMVNFGSLNQPQNIGMSVTPQGLTQNSFTIDNVRFSYVPSLDAQDPAVNTSVLCGFDAGAGGINPVPGCVGAQVDSGGIAGTTDGNLLMHFDTTAYALQFSFSFLGWDGLPPGQTFSVGALFSYQGNIVGFGGQDGSTPTPLGGTLLASDGVFSFSTLDQDPFVRAPFDEALLIFSPTAVLDGTTGQLAFGRTSFQVNDVSYDYVPEPGSITLFALGGLAIGVSRLIKRKL